MAFFGDKINGDTITGDKVLGDKNIYEINHIDLDIGILKDILENNPTLIKTYLQKLNTIPNEFSADEKTIPISDKNLLNGLSDFYNEFIKKEEQKLASIDKFFKDNDYLDDIENASDSIRMFIFTYANRNSMKLELKLFNKIIQIHTKQIIDSRQKSIMKLIIFYLYRYCYIGLKDA
jgi:hypothetical protein